MALTNVELYEALKPTVGEEAARLMASVVPPAENLATKLDVADAKADLIAKLSEINDRIAGTNDRIAGTNDRIAGLETKMEASMKELMRWMLVMFIPVWAGVWGTVIAVLLKH